MKRPSRLGFFLFAGGCILACVAGVTVLILGAWLDPGMPTYPDKVLVTVVHAIFAVVLVGVVVFFCWVLRDDLEDDDDEPGGDDGL